jgi:O-methyltransferase
MSDAGHLGGAWTEETHHQIYPDNFNHGLAKFLTEIISPSDFLEFGGGVGALSRYISENTRIGDSFMIEPKINIAFEKAPNLRCLNFDITKDVAPAVLNRSFDLVVSIEVAEHIERIHHERLFDFLAARAKRWVVFSAARQGQGGYGHVAERSETEWREEFLSRGFTFDARLTALARSMSDRKNINHKRNLQVFCAPPDRLGLSKIEEIAAPHLEVLLSIVRGKGDFLDGNLFFANLQEAIEGRPSHALRWKRENVVTIAKNAKQALEVGFNAGHAALLMLIANRNLVLTCVDRLDYPYSLDCFAYLSAAFPGRLKMIPGDSVDILPTLKPTSYDLVHLDGGKEKTMVNDLSALRQLVEDDHVIIIDDTNNSAIDSIILSAASVGDINLFSFSNLNTKVKKSRWHHKLVQFSLRPSLENEAIKRMRSIYHGSTHPSIYMVDGPDGVSPGIARVKALANAMKDIEASKIDGAFVEVGVAAGHSSVLAALMSSRFQPREFFLFDTFEGFGETPDERDMLGRSISSYDLSAYTGVECQSGMVRDRMRSAGIRDENLLIVEGRVEETVSQFAPKKISILRLDADLYSPTKIALEIMYDRVQPGGWLIIDDYGHWDGCRRATEEFFASRGEAFAGVPVDYTCYVLRK